MPPRYTARSRTSASHTVSHEAQDVDAALIPENGGDDADTQDTAEIVESVVEQEIHSPFPASFANGMVEKRWSGLPMWACTRCGHTTFNNREARKHACNGRV